MKRILWICGRLPSPLFSGDALYSAGLLQALAQMGEAELTILGTRRNEQAIEKPFLGLPSVTCVDVAPPKASGMLSLLSTAPKDAHRLATPEFKATLLKLLEQPWDWLVIDHAYSSGLFNLVVRRRQSASICYVGHNAEGLIRPEIARNVQGLARRTITQIDAEKYRRQERRILHYADAVICITDDDALYFRQFIDNVHVLPPIFLGKAAEDRSITPSTPRALLLLGSFDWIAKQRNLDIIVEELVPIFRSHGIALNVVGTVPEAVRTRHAHEEPHLTFHGRLSSISDFASRCRGGLVPELLGGGFKLKVLDYAFARLPIFGLDGALAGMTSEEKSAMFLAKDMTGLGATIVENINEFDKLNRSQAQLLALFSRRFGLAQCATRMQEVFMNQPIGLNLQ